MRDPFGLRGDRDDWGDRGDQGDEEHSPGRLSAATRAAGAGVLLLVVVAVAAAGAAGLLVSLSVLAVLATLVLVLRMPSAPAPAARRRPGPPVENAPFRAYRQVSEQLSWAAVSSRHYDLVTRPLLTQLAAARLADRHRVDLHADPGAARALLGEDVWPWVDPTRDVSRDSQPPGIGQERLTRIVERLEQL